MPETRGARAAERIVQVDALRGFCLFGILCANILFWAGWEFMTPEQLTAAFGAAPVARLWFWHKLIVDGKFYTLFSTLFGMGFCLQLSRLEQRGADGLRIFRRRMLVLLGIGLVHLVIFWPGDILTLYALVGFLLPFVRGWSNRSLLAWGVALLILPIPANAAMDALGWHPANMFVGLGIGASIRLGVDGRDMAHWLGSGGLDHWILFDLTGVFFRIFLILQSWRIPKVIGIMLIGVVLGRKMLEGTLLANRRLLTTTLVLGLLVGVPSSWLYALDPTSDQTNIGSLLGTVPLAYAYGAAFLLAWTWAKPVLALLAAPGRMALTNYLGQTLMGCLIFYGAGLGWIGRTSPGPLYATAVAIYALEMLWSHLWLARFEQGPMEWLWRRLTYGQLSSRATEAQAEGLTLS